jgi:hypothetical protein
MSAEAIDKDEGNRAGSLWALFWVERGMKHAQLNLAAWGSGFSGPVCFSKGTRPEVRKLGVFECIVWRREDARDALEAKLNDKIVGVAEEACIVVEVVHAQAVEAVGTLYPVGKKRINSTS